METRRDFETLLAGKNLGTHLTVYGGVRPQDNRVRSWLMENGCLP